MSKVLVTSMFAAASLVGCAAEEQSTDEAPIVAGAGYTTFDATLGGCLDGKDPNGVNCNNYAGKQFVYETGGPTSGGLSDGYYYFAVLVPGSQHGGYLDGAPGNLSSSNDAFTNRIFHVVGGKIVANLGSHTDGTDPQGDPVIALAPFDDTTNDGGVYVLAICATDQLGSVLPASDKACKFDAFRIGESGAPSEFPVVTGMKYYDANANGQWDSNEVGIAGWNIDYTDEVGGTVTTDASGRFSLTLIADTYRFGEEQGNGTWMQTGNSVDQTLAAGGASATLNADKSYTVTVVDNSRVDGLFFGNLCVGAGGGLTLGFWSNKNGAALVGAADLAFLSSLNLRNANGADFNPTGYSQLRSWLLNATATNMAYMLSAQLATMALNVRHNFVQAGALIYAPGAQGANAAGFATVQDVMDEANTSLGSNGYTVASGDARTYQEALKTALDNANNNKTFVQSGPDRCPAPAFTPYVAP